MIDEQVEKMSDFEKFYLAGQLIISGLGEKPDRDGIIQTPKRFAKFWQEFKNFDPGNTDVTFEAIQTDQMIAVTGIRVWSLCEHHMLPFWTDLSIGYIAGDVVLGLSKFARIAHQAAHRLQIQERLVDDIAEEIMRITSSKDVAVVGRGVHLCMVMRGVRTPGTMVSSAMYGVFRSEPEARQEFLALTKE